MIERLQSIVPTPDYVVLPSRNARAFGSVIGAQRLRLDRRIAARDREVLPDLPSVLAASPTPNRT